MTFISCFHFAEQKNIYIHDSVHWRGNCHRLMDNTSCFPTALEALASRKKREQKRKKLNTSFITLKQWSRSRLKSLPLFGGRRRYIQNGENQKTTLHFATLEKTHNQQLQPKNVYTEQSNTFFNNQNIHLQPWKTDENAKKNICIAVHRLLHFTLVSAPAITRSPIRT